MNKMEGKPILCIDLTEDQESTIDENIESYIQEVNVEEDNVYIHEVQIEQIIARKYRTELKKKNPEVFTVKKLGCFKYVVKKISKLSVKNKNNKSFVEKKNQDDHDSTLNNENSCSIEQIPTEENESFTLDTYDIPYNNSSYEHNLSDGNESVEIYPQYLNLESNYEECDDSNESSTIHTYNIPDNNSSYENNLSDNSENVENNSQCSNLEGYYEECDDSNEPCTLDAYDEVIESNTSDASENEVNYSQFLNLKRNYEECSSSHERSNSNRDVVPCKKLKKLDERSSSTSSYDEGTNASGSNNKVDNTVYLLDSSDDEDNSNTTKLVLPKVSEVRNLNKIIYIPTTLPNKVFPDYSEEVLSELKNFVANKTLEDLVHDHVKQLCTLRIDDLLRVFMPDNWLNDLIIQYYLELLIKNCNNKILNLTSFFMESIIAHNKIVASSYKNKNIFDYDKIIVPIFSNNHWTLIVVDIQTHEIIHFNSFDYVLYNEILIIKEFLRLAYEDRKQPGDADAINWTDRNGNSPKQDNHNDCGVFICTNARYIIFNKQSNFSQEDIPLLRHRITYEIVHNILLPTQ